MGKMTGDKGRANRSATALQFIDLFYSNEPGYLDWTSKPMKRTHLFLIIWLNTSLFGGGDGVLVYF